MADKAGGIPAVGHPHLPDLFADDVIALDQRDGTVRMTLATLKLAEPAAPAPIHYVAVGRLVMTVPGAQRLALALFDYLKKQGLDPTTMVRGDDAKVN